MAISNQFLSDTLGPIYTSTGSYAMVVGYFCNTHIAPITFSLHLVPNGGTANSTNIIYKDINLTSNDTYVLDVEKIIFETGDAIHAVASIDAVVAATINTVSI